MMLLFEVLFDYFKNILELTIENRVKSTLEHVLVQIKGSQVTVVENPTNPISL